MRRMCTATNGPTADGTLRMLVAPRLLSLAAARLAEGGRDLAARPGACHLRHQLAFTLGNARPCAVWLLYALCASLMHLWLQPLGAQICSLGPQAI